MSEAVCLYSIVDRHIVPETLLHVFQTDRTQRGIEVHELFFNTKATKDSKAFLSALCV